jgi:hypothetical protein
MVPVSSWTSSKVLPTDIVVNVSEVMMCWSQLLDEFVQLESLSDGNSFWGRLNGFPVHTIEVSIGPPLDSSSDQSIGICIYRFLEIPMILGAVASVLHFIFFSNNTGFHIFIAERVIMNVELSFWLQFSVYAGNKRNELYPCWQMMASQVAPFSRILSMVNNQGEGC